MELDHALELVLVCVCATRAFFFFLVTHTAVFVVV